MQSEVAKAAEEDQVFRRYGAEFMGYMSFIMQRP
jgi:hypothetical protein